MFLVVANGMLLGLMGSLLGYGTSLSDPSARAVAHSGGMGWHGLASCIVRIESRHNRRSIPAPLAPLATIAAVAAVAVPSPTLDLGETWCALEVIEHVKGVPVHNMCTLLEPCHLSPP